MLRLAAALVLLLLSGCLASAPAPLAVAPMAPDDGVVVTATRVQPLAHSLDREGRIAAHACQREQPDGCTFAMLGPGSGFQWESPTFDSGDPRALFWRVTAVAEWSTQARVDRMRLEVAATTPCGIGCLEEREVEAVEGPDLLQVDHLDVYLEPGETGIRLRLQPIGTMETTLVHDIDYHIVGEVVGYRAAGPPVVVS